MRIRSVKFNFIMNFLLTASSIIFPLITFPYVSRVLQAAGNGKVAFATAVLTYFTMFASLGIPTYGIRVCAQVRDDREKLSRTVQELLIINTITMVIVYAVFAVMVFLVPEFAKEKELLFINSITMVLNVFGVSWFYSALEQYAYITACSLTFKVISIVMMFAWVKNPKDYIIYGAITVFASAGSYVLNFINLHKYVTLKKKGPYNFKRHLKPIGIFFAMSAATSVYTNLDVVMIQFIKDETEVGYYNAAVKVKTILVSLITSLGTVLLPRLSFYVKQKEQDAFRKTIVKAFNFVLILASSVMLYFMIFARETILTLSGSEYLPSILPMILLMPTVLFIGLSNITGIQILTPLGREREVLISIICGAVVDFVLNLILIGRYGASGAAFATLLAELIVLAVQCVYLKDMLSKVVREISLGKTAAALAAAGIVGGVLKMQLELPSFIMICITGVAFYGVFGMALLILKEPFVMEMWEMVKNMLYKGYK
ncbi:flippase [Muricomes sp. OA1]|uniref:Flippase n=1 Tax=Hungatella hathewayi TaxID=154046 RepID=A0A3E2WNQ3_9FIRM|nr:MULTISPECIES: flippase [Clostridia]MCH1973702.1 flippase [Muricomes sp. OA1]RGC28208.1 flippase [Hungatella hathewayi]GKH32468.1 flippase [Faecalicatena contorta]